MPNDLERSLPNGERIIEKAMFSSAEMIFSWLFYAFFLVLSLIISFSSSNFSVGFFALGFFRIPFFIFSIYVTANYFSKEMAITESRIIMKSGALSKRITDIPLDRIQNVHVKQGIIGSSAGYGTLIIYTITTSYRCDYIKEPEIFKNRIFQQTVSMRKQNEACNLPPNMIFCGNCGKQNPVNNAYCRYCGKRM